MEDVVNQNLGINVFFFYCVLICMHMSNAEWEKMG